MGKRRWYFQELEHAGSEHLEAAQVAMYDRKTSFDPSREVEHLKNFGLSATSTFVDLGAGTGTLALELAKHCRRVVAVDISPTMLTLVKQKADEANVRNLELVQAGLLEYEHQGEPVDFVYSRNVLHHLPDFWKMQALVRIARFLKPGGVFRLRDLVYSFEPQQSEEHIAAWLSAAPDDAEAGVTRAELEAHVRDEFSTYTWLLEAMLEKAAFEVSDVEYSNSRIFAEYTCIFRG